MKKSLQKYSECDGNLMATYQTVNQLLSKTAVNIYANGDCRSQEEKEMIWKLECLVLVVVVIYVWWSYHMPYFLLLMLTLAVWFTQPTITAKIRYADPCIFHKYFMYLLTQVCNLRMLVL